MNESLKRVLLIGNENPHLQLLADYCDQAKVSTTVASSIESAHEKMHLQHYDLLVFDLDLRRKPNVELIQEIDAKNAYIPLVLITDDYQQSQRLIFGLFELDIRGSWHILEKPFQAKTFTRHIREILADEGDVLVSEPLSADNTYSERRKFFRRPQFQPIRFSYEQSQYGSRFKTVTRGFLTNVSRGGIGILTNRNLVEQQYLSFENGLLCGTGLVAWQSPVDETTHKVGIRFG